MKTTAMAEAKLFIIASSVSFAFRKVFVAKLYGRTHLVFKAYMRIDREVVEQRTVFDLPWSHHPATPQD